MDNSLSHGTLQLQVLTYSFGTFIFGNLILTLESVGQNYLVTSMTQCLSTFMATWNLSTTNLKIVESSVPAGTRKKSVFGDEYLWISLAAMGILSFSLASL